MCKANVILLIYLSTQSSDQHFDTAAVYLQQNFQRFQERPCKSGKANGKYFSSLSRDLVSRIQRHFPVVIVLLEDLNLKHIPLTIKSLRQVSPSGSHSTKTMHLEKTFSSRIRFQLVYHFQSMPYGNLNIVYTCF